MSRRRARTVTSTLTVGLLAATLAACGGGDDGAEPETTRLSEADACTEYHSTWNEMSGRAQEVQGAAPGSEEFDGLFDEYATTMDDLAARSPESLAPLFSSEADFGRAMAGDGDMELEAVAENTAAIEEICGPSGSGA